MFPKIDHPIFEFIVPSLGKKIKLRPYLVKEEKILLMAKESTDNMDIFKAIKQVVNNCILDDIDVDTLTLFDVEYLFTQLKGISVDNQVKINLTDEEDGEEYNFEFDVTDIKVEMPKKDNFLININKKNGIKLKYPTISTYLNDLYINEKDQSKKIQIYIANCVDQIFDESNIYPIDETNLNEMIEYLDNLDLKTYQKILQFVNSIPAIKYDIKYTNKKGNNVVITLNKLTDFFIL